MEYINLDTLMDELISAGLTLKDANYARSVFINHVVHNRLKVDLEYREGYQKFLNAINLSNRV